MQAIVVVELFGIGDLERMRIASEIRTRVFVEEQAVPLDEEFDVHDRTDPGAVHALAFTSAGEPVAVGRLFLAEPETAQISRMAVVRHARGSGAGVAVLRALLAEARRRGYARAQLYAQTHARGFYLKSGFCDDGDRFWEVGIEHQPMSLALREPA
jgi:ElaA protein